MKKLCLIDVNEAVIVIPPDLSDPEKKAIIMLVEEVEKRTQIRWTTTATWPSTKVPVIAVGSVSALNNFAGAYTDEFAQDGGVLPCADQVGMNGKGRFEGCQRLCFAVEGGVNQAAAGQSAEMARLQRQSALNVLNGMGEVLQHEQHRRSLVPAFRIVRFHLDDAVQQIERE